MRMIKVTNPKKIHPTRYLDLSSIEFDLHFSIPLSLSLTAFLALSVVSLHVTEVTAVERDYH